MSDHTILDVEAQLFLPEPVSSSLDPAVHQALHHINGVDGVQDQSLQLQLQHMPNRVPPTTRRRLKIIKVVSLWIWNKSYPREP